MKDTLLFLLFVCFLINSIKTEFTMYNLTNYNKLTYNSGKESITILNIEKINENEIYITYKIKNNKFISNSIKYIFTNDYPNNNTNLEFPDLISCTDSKESNKGHRLHFKIKKQEKKYLILENLQSETPGEIEIENTKPSSKAVIVIAIISVVLIIGIIGAFIFIGKYIFNKRQKELMTNYASSFVDENPSLIPNDNNQEEVKVNKLDE